MFLLFFTGYRIKKMKKIPLLIVLFGLCLFSYENKLLILGTTTLNPIPVDDAYVTDHGESYGARNITLFGNDVDGQIPRGYLKFNVPIIPANATINSAILSIIYLECAGTPVPNTFTVGQVKSAWTEETITWANKPASEAVISTSATCDGPNTTKTIDVKTIVDNWRKGDPNYGFAFSGPTSGFWFRGFYSKEAVASNIPKLTITYSTPSTAPTSSVTATTTTASTTAVRPPKLTQLLLNGSSKSLADAVIAFPEDTIIAKGTADAGATVKFFVGNQTFSAVADSSGNWNAPFDMGLFINGEQTVNAQVINVKGAASEVAGLFSFERIDVESLSADKKSLSMLEKVLNVISSPFVGIILLLIVAGIAAAIVMVVIRHRRKIKKLSDENAIVDEKAKPGVPDKE